MQHLRLRALGQQARTDLQNVGTCCISLSCRVLPLILRNARNGEVWNSGGELHRASYSGEASCPRTPVEFTDQSQQITTELASLLLVPVPKSASGL